MGRIQLLFGVAILILMEDALRLKVINEEEVHTGYVAILILMEDALRHQQFYGLRNFTLTSQSLF